MSTDQYELDEVERGILHLLQNNALDNANNEIGNDVGVSAGTVRNRIHKLEEAGVIRGYVPDIDYERAGYQLHILITCTSGCPSDELTKNLLDQQGVINVRRLLAGRENYHIEAVGTDTNDVSAIANAIRECELEIERSDVLDESWSRPFDHFGQDLTTQTSNG